MDSSRSGRLTIPQNCRIILESILEWLLIKKDEGYDIEDLIRRILTLIKEEKYIEPFAKTLFTNLKGESQNGVFIQKENFRNIVNFFLQRLKRNQIVYLHEKGVDIRRITKSRPRDSKVFIVGDHKGIDKKDERWLVTKEISMVSIGPISYLSSHSITIVLEEIFRAQENL